MSGKPNETRVEFWIDREVIDELKSFYPSYGSISRVMRLVVSQHLKTLRRLAAVKGDEQQ